MATKIKGKWGEEQMKMAVDNVLSGKLSIREAAGHFSVPKSTLADRVKDLKGGKSVTMTATMGRFKKTLSDDIEIELVNHLKDLDNRLLPVTKPEFLSLVYQLVEHMKIPHQFNKNKRKAGNKFYVEFIKRHPEFSLRCAESTSLQRAVGFNRSQVNLFFSKYEELVNKFSFPPNRIFNCDETGVSVVHENSLKVLSIKGKKQVSKLTSGERGRNITVLLCINAAGDQFIPPLFVFPRKRMDQSLKKDAPEGSLFDAQESGWISTAGFLKWLKGFVERVNPTKESPVLLILDGHSTHKDLQVILYAKQNNVHMISLPPHTTHKLQPLDRAIMRPFKTAFNEACGNWMQKYGKLGLKITDKDICSLVNTAFTAICRMDLAKSAFKCTGIYPFNKFIFTDVDFVPSMNRPIPEERLQAEVPLEDAISVSPSASRNEENPDDDVLPRPEASPLPVTIFADIARPSTSRNFHKMIEEISPVADELERKLSTRRRRGESSEVLTSTPYKKVLEEKEKAKEQKKEKAERKKNASQKEDSLEHASGKRKAVKKDTNVPQFLKKSKRMLTFENGNDGNEVERGHQNKNEDVKDETECVICGETFQEDWVQCLSCGGWAHEQCTDIDNISFFRCDRCK